MPDNCKIDMRCEPSFLRRLNKVFISLADKLRPTVLRIIARVGEVLCLPQPNASECLRERFYIPRNFLVSSHISSPEFSISKSKKYTLIDELTYSGRDPITIEKKNPYFVVTPNHE